MRNKTNWYWYALFVLPLFTIFTLVVIIPFFIGIGYSFYSWDGLPLNPKTFVGFQNYIDLFTDTRFMSSMVLTTKFTLITIIFINVIGFTFAQIVTTKFKVANIMRAMLFMPYLLGGLILGYVWKFIFTEVFAFIGELTGLTGIFFNWLLDPQYALYALILVTTWQMSGYVMIVYIAGFQSIPEEVLEAAKVDGAGYFRTLFNVKMPLLMPSFTICLFLTLSNCFKLYDASYSLTGGGPNNATELFAMNIFNEIFKLNNFGYGQAKGIVFFLLVASFTVLQVVYTKRREVEM